MEKNLGHATAYGYAKSKGYSGTEDEFAELMADYASVGQSAAQSAEQAAESATSASGSAATATQAAQTATSKASEAVTAADTATTKATEASTSADTASAAATSAITSAQTATTAAATATTKASEASESATTASAAKTDAESARDAAAQSASEAAASAESIDPETLEHKAYGAYVVESASGAIASFDDGADSIPMKDVLVHIDPVQAGSGDPSPDNVRPITGWTGAKVTRTGKNLLPPPVAETFTQNGVTVTASPDGSYTAVGTTSGGSFIHKFALYEAITIKDGMYWHVMNDDPRALCSVALISGGKNISDITLAPKNRIIDLSNLAGKTVEAYQFFVANNQETNITLKPMFVLNSTATEYEPYSGQIYDITFPSEAGTVYGGTLNVTKGELVVDRAYLELGSKHWTKVANKTSAYVSAFGSTVPLAIGAGSVANMLCTCYKVASATNVLEESLPCSIAQGRPGLYESYWIINDATHANEGIDLENYLNGQYICYLLATPIVYTLTPQEITSLLGENNLWADTGDSEVEYRADTKLYITKKITEAVSALS